MAKVSNPRFPHTCTVYKLVGGDAWTESEKQILYQGECCKYGSGTLRTFSYNGVIKGDYAIDIPGLVENVCTGCLVDVTDFTGSYEGLVLTDAYPSYMGTTLFFNMPKN